MNTQQVLTAFSLGALLVSCLGCSADATDDSFASSDRSDEEGKRGGMGKADGVGMPGACGDLTSGESPDGCWCDDACCDYADCCSEDKGKTCVGAPAAPPSPIPSLELSQGKGSFVVNGGAVFEGTLERDGSAGMTYLLNQPEGYVCGQLSLTKWDPFDEGSGLKNAIAVRWRAPDGSVAASCAPEIRPLEGVYQGNTDLFQGSFKWSRPMPKDYMLVLDQGKGTLYYKGLAIIEGGLQPDGTAGFSYNLYAEEGFVCGSLHLTKLDPNNEGYTMTNALNVTWTKPGGSVVNDCDAGFTWASGIYSGDEDGFSGVFSM